MTAPESRGVNSGQFRHRNVAEPPPFGWRLPLVPRKGSGHVALVDKAAFERDLDEVLVAFPQELLSAFDSPFDQPSMRRHAGGVPERPGKMACG